MKFVDRAAHIEYIPLRPRRGFRMPGAANGDFLKWRKIS